MRILFAASECVPFAKSGGLADVVGALPKALRRLGHEVIIVMPRYYEIDRSLLDLVPGALEVSMGYRRYLAGLYKSTLPRSDVEVYFVDYEEFYGRKGLYSDERGFGYPDNDRRFIFLSKAALAVAKKIGFRPDIIHAHDWHTAPLALLAHLDGYTPVVLTLHNLQHQGVFGKEAIELMEIGWEHFNPFEFEALGAVNLLKGGIYHADALTTVSPTYAKEIQTPEFGFGLDEHIRAHAHKLRGILNGVDYEDWNPASDTLIPANYDVGWMEGKSVCKAQLQGRMGLEKRDDIPLVGFVGRLVEQKGITLIAQAMEGIVHLQAQYLFLGTGEKWAEGFLQDIARRYANVATYIGFSNELAHQIEAGSDLFLMPSLFEPCGLNQLYSLRYGTPPIVTAVGGLNDTVQNFDPKTKEGTGFKFYERSAAALYHTLRWAIDTWREDKEGFALLQRRGMQQRFDWQKAAKEYEEVYYALL